MEARLVAVYGDDWLTAVNEHRAAKGVPAGRRLADHRFCLSVFGFDPATQGRMHENLRRMARELAGLARKAATTTC